MQPVQAAVHTRQVSFDGVEREELPPNFDSVKQVIDSIEKDQEVILEFVKKKNGVDYAAFEVHMRAVSTAINMSVVEIFMMSDAPIPVEETTSMFRYALVNLACDFNRAQLDFKELQEYVVSQRDYTRVSVQDMSQQFGRMNLKEAVGTQRVAKESLGTYSFPSADKLGKCVRDHKLIKDPAAQYLKDKGVVGSIPHAFADDTAVSLPDMRQRIVSNLAVNGFERAYEITGTLLEKVLVDCAKK